jgi:hypothetical protein
MQISALTGSILSANQHRQLLQHPHPALLSFECHDDDSFSELAHIIDTSNAKTQLASSMDTTMQLLANEAHTPILFYYFENPNTIQLPLIPTWLNHNE